MNKALEILRSDIRSMPAYHVQPSSGMVKLDVMENPYRLPADLQAKLGERLGQVAINRYPAERTMELGWALARHAGMPEHCAVTLGNGSDEIITMISMAISKPGAVVLAPSPSFVMYELSSRYQHLRFESVPLTAEFELDESAMLAAIEKHHPAAIYLAYPNNPTGGLWNWATIERIVQAAPGLVIMDEAYQPFASRDAMALLAQYPHVLVMRTMSKFGLAGVRIGYLMGEKSLVQEIDKLRPPFNVGVLNAEAALFALEYADVYAAQAAELRAQRELVASELAACAGVHVFPSQGNMLLLRVPDANARFKRMRELGVLIKNVSAGHALLANCLRITIGTPEENQAMLKAFKESL